MFVSILGRFNPSRFKAVEYEVSSGRMFVRSLEASMNVKEV